MGNPNRPSVAVIGGGIFGTRTAIELAQTHDVTLFEKNSDLFTGATYANHNRHHYGFHYPRSPETIQQCLKSGGSFEREFGECVDWDFDNYYCVSADRSLTSPERYLNVCRDFGLHYEECKPDPVLIDPKKVSLCLKVREGVYDIAILKRLITHRIAAIPSLRVRLSAHVTGGRLVGHDKKRLTVTSGGETEEMVFDFVVNATYTATNQFCVWFGFPTRTSQFNLQELDIVELPLERRIGITVQDGPFPSILPIAHSRRYLMAHVIESQLVREISSSTLPLLSRISFIESRWDQIQDVCCEYLPILRQAHYIRSLFVDRTVDAARLSDDSRVTEITDHGHGCWSIFAAKVITCVLTAQEIHRKVREVTP